MWQSSRRATRALAVLGLTLVVQAGTALAAPNCWEPPVVAPIVDPYREPACRWCPGNRGIEYATRPGTVVRAVAAGRVTFVGSVAGTRYVVVEHANGWRVTYGILRDVAVEHGDVVVRGSIVGTTTARFHFGLRDRAGYRDPAPHLGRWVHQPRLVPIDGSPGPSPGPPRLRCDTRPNGPATLRKL